VEQLRKQRDELNRQASEAARPAREAVQKLRAMRASVDKEREARDKENSLVKDFKAKRDSANARIKQKLEELNAIQASLPRSLPKLNTAEARRELSRLEWRVTAEVLDVKQEEKIAKRIAFLEEVCKSSQEFSEKSRQLRRIKAELDELRKEAQAFHSVMLQHAKQSEEHHARILELREGVKAVLPVFKAAKEKAVAATKAADEVHARFREAFSKTKEGQQAAVREQARERNARMREQAARLFDEFRKGRKLTTDELRIIQSFSGD
jgi:phosphoserine phosphatase